MGLGWAGGMRAVGDWTIALNFRFADLDPVGYRVINVAIHVLAAVTLFVLVRTTLSSPALGDRFRGRETAAALAIALLWAVHPPQTQAVTYIIQRYESLITLRYLAALYFLVRGALATSALGMFTKEAMATLPAAAIL